MSAGNISRRTFLTLSALLGGSPVFAGPIRSGADPVFLSAASDAEGRHWLQAFALAGDAVEVRFSHRLPERAHAVAVEEDLGLFVAVARRPGGFLLVGNTAGDVLQELTVPEGRHLFGHGVFSADGRRFYTTENDYDNMDGDSGLVAVWDVTPSGLERVGEFPAYGVGPHELLLMPDERTLVVANGGIRTHPDSGRDKLNLDTMTSSLIYIDRVSGALKDRYALPAEFHRNSIRHLDVNADGMVALTMQYQGEPFHSVPLVATHVAGDEIRPLPMPEPVRIRMQQYVGSVRFDNSGRYIAASCPRGNMITFWDATEGTFIEQVRARDGCGLCALDEGFLISAGSTGAIRHYDLGTGSVRDFTLDGAALPEHIFWDNHLIAAQGA